ncbi:MAG: hypothetical protein AAFX92_08950 [Pseudomonadota bacterium]
MPRPTQRFPIAALMVALLPTGSLTNVAAAAATEAASVDPPVFVTNLSDAPVALQWQTVQPDSALSPIRGATIAENAMATRAEEGLFWFYDPADEGPVENVVFVSIVDADGAFLSQVVMEEEIAGTLATVEETALHITIEADMTLTLSIQDTE